MILSNQYSVGTLTNFPSADLLIRHAISIFFFKSRTDLYNLLWLFFLPGYKGIKKSSFYEINRHVLQDSIYLDMQIGRYIDHCLSRYLICCIVSRLFNWLRISFSSYTVPPSIFWREEIPSEQPHVRIGRRRRPSYDGRFPIALPLPLTGQKGPIFQRKSEQAEVGQSLTCLPSRYREGCFENPPGVLMTAESGKIQENGTLGRVLYIQWSGYVA